MIKSIIKDGMKIKRLLSEYKNIANEMKEEAKKYNYLSSVVRHSCSDKTFAEYRISWKRLITMNEKAYSIMYEYRTLCSSLRYKAMFLIGILPKQNSFRYINDTEFKCTQMINLLNIK